MQQHSGQHLLSHVLWENGLKTVSVHLGENYTMIEVEGDFPDDILLQKIEDEANQLIRQAILIKSFIADRKKADKLPLRKPAGNWAELRIVEINGMDYSACGGTHVNNTSEIGLIKYIDSEKIRGHARLKFVIGELAYEYFSQLHNVVNQIKELLQTDPAQFPEKLNGLVEDLIKTKKENNQLKKYYIRYQCEEILNKTKQESVFIVHELANESFEDIKEISKKLTDEKQKISFIFGNGRFCLCAPESSTFDAGKFLHEQGQDLNLKGGGPREFVQGVYKDINPQKVKEILTEILNNR
jgi:alanyl-tRNA synthetase